MREDGDSGMDGDPIGARLAAPIAVADLAKLPQRWFHAEVVALCRPPRGWSVGDLVWNPAFPGRLRGAWGRQLLNTASPVARHGGPCPWSPPCAYDPLFREHPALMGLETPKPYVIAADPAPDGLDLMALRLTLFGFATDWLESAADAWVLALRGGVAMPNGLHAALEPLDRRIAVHEGVAASAPPAAARLHFVTPLCLRRGGTTHGGVGSLFTSLGNRLSGMARWLDTTVVADWRSLKEHAATLTIDASSLRPLAWHRHSARQGDAPIRMEGLRGTVTLTGDLGPLWPLLTLGALTHAGSHAAQGLGRYSMEPLTV
ncbi:CRISPR system precrRNA processing endoribonuclease RAMP protein Cas6 [Azospirillum agricola]|uniref:CRISPR system precrRNA processing endoribonuclease RAMP protein Cas6 n=1 Tax=Azospirillum agricola TaxID=1720247 RepID=UPI000A0EF926|nr:CRISPR system precrRNA processing endoribonuclease RAMP protein Cas6 [Azospirillum agricola]SMH30323.1 Uncharacterized conserved protein [Azospirillum lipoferum]